MQSAKKHHLESFFIEEKDGHYDVKVKWFIRVVSNRKVVAMYSVQRRKEAVPQSYALFNREIWLVSCPTCCRTS